MKKILSGLLLSLILTVSAAQDSLKTLSGQQVTEIVKRFHPVAKQADILMEKAKADLTIARGLFDPTLENSNARKTFDGNEYYYYNRPELAVPTWFGIELRAGLEYLSGNRTDPTDTRGESSYFGISVPLAKNLLMDKRRAALQTAKIFREASAIEKRNILNDLLQDALKAYWKWVADYQQYRILSEAVKVNEKRVALVKTAFRLGDRPAIDTAEALTQLQSFEVLQSQAWMDFQNAGLELSLYLWTANNQPYYLPETILPADELQQIRSSAFVLPELTSLLEAARKNHPELLLYNYKLDALGIEKKLKFQELLPVLN
jgi:outer membrane protein TolC